MTRYRKIDVRMWDDARFKTLSPMQPSGRSLWIFLLTNPETSVIPGCYRATESGMAEYLGWSLEAFREAFREVFLEGLAKASWKDRLIWIPNACKYDPPVSPNVIKSWRVVWDELPECKLKNEIWHGLKDFTEGLSKAFQDAFREACPQPSRNPEPEPEPEPDTTPGTHQHTSVRCEDHDLSVTDVEQLCATAYGPIGTANAKAIAGLRNLSPYRQWEIDAALGAWPKRWSGFVDFLTELRSESEKTRPAAAKDKPRSEVPGWQPYTPPVEPEDPTT